MEFGVKNLIFIAILIAAAVLLIKNLIRKFSYLKVARQDDERNDRPGERLMNMFKVAFAQSKILREPAAGFVHVMIFWGFLVLLFSASSAVFQGIFGSFSWAILGPLFSIISFATDIFCVAITIAVIFALVRRFVSRVPRLQGDKEEAKDAMIVLGAILVIVVSLFFENAAASVIKTPSEWAFYPISSAVGSIFSAESAVIIYEIGWWIHILAILAFANYLPFSKHFHVYTSIPNVYFSHIGPANTLEKMDFEAEVEKFGVVDIDDLSWKNIYDSYTCTHCGRCTASCPANLTGKVLSPREVIVQIRNRTEDAAPIMLKRMGEIDPDSLAEEIKLDEKEQEVFEKKFVGDYENIEALWQCTTCGACMKECPVMIEHVPVIVGMRRNLVMMESNFPQLLQTAFGNLENNSTPWAFPQAERADWAEGLDIPTAAENPDFDVLFWVGCAGSFDDRSKKISIAFAKLLKAAGVNFAILGTEEHCNGDVARRTGHEYLADMLIKMNVETLNNYNVKKIVAFCPHCFNTLKNEYPEFGGEFEVVHHTEFLCELIEQGRLKLKSNGASQSVAYHDSCYLGRYNNIYDKPRNILKKLGLKIEEPARTGDRGLCCGAGGGQMFMEETEGKRVNIERTEELIGCGASTIALNCPFCMTMVSDGVKAADREEDIRVLDISEILLEHVEMSEEK
ncbi:MAG: heterodisulfide reductase-related iron-sulfur binding cluster [Candidatus Kapaibacterium sp.]